MANTLLNKINIDNKHSNSANEAPLTLYQTLDLKKNKNHLPTRFHNNVLLQRRSTAPIRKTTIATPLVKNQSRQSQQSASSGNKKIGPYLLGKTLGAGSMGKVKLAYHESSSHKVAIKIINRKTNTTNLYDNKNKTKSIDEDSRVFREVGILSLLKHDNILKLLDFYITANHFYLITEHVDGCQLLDYITTNGILNEKKARDFSRQLLSGLDYCHQNSIVHRDLKIENILVTKNGQIKIIDFGLSNLYSQRSLLSTFCGSLYFAAPELLSGKKYIGPEVDIWSFGVILYVAVCGRVPFEDSNFAILHNKIKQDPVVYPKNISADCVSLLKRILVKDPSRRATLNEISEHTWLNIGYSEKIHTYINYDSILSFPVDINAVKKLEGFKLGPIDTVKTQIEREIIAINKRSSSTDKIAKPNYLNYPLISLYRLAVEKTKNEGLNYSRLSLHDSKNMHHNNLSKTDTNYSKINISPANTFENNLYATRKTSEYISSCAPSENNTTYAVAAKQTQTQNQQLDFSTYPLSSKCHTQTNTTLKRGKSIALANKVAKQAIIENKHHTCFARNKTSVENNNALMNQEASSGVLETSEVVTKQGEKSMLNNMQSLYLKGLFSVSNTSSLDPEAIREKIISALESLKIMWTEENGYLLIMQNESVGFLPKSTNSPKKSNARIIKTKLSSIKERLMSTNRKNKPGDKRLLFEMQLVRLPMLKIYGIKFKRLSGSFWEYKNFCSAILDHMDL